MTKDELLELFDAFINEIGEWNTFRKFLEEKGYSAKEYDTVMDTLEL